MRELLASVVGLLRAYARRLVCRWRGHVFDRQVMAPEGTVYCRRCRERIPVYPRRQA
jgi:hypothetical protein